MTELLRKYLYDTFDMNCYKVNQLTDYIVELTDINHEKISIMNLGYDIIVYIDDKEYEILHYNAKRDLWVQKLKEGVR